MANCTLAVSQDRQRIFVTCSLDVLASSVPADTCGFRDVGTIARNQRLKLNSPRVHERLKSLIERPTGPINRHVLAVDDEQKASGRYLLVSTVEPSPKVQQHSGNVFELTFVDLKKPLTIPPQVVRRDLKLTLTEAKLCIALANDGSLRGFATETGLTIGTARWHWANIRRKLGVRTQTALVRMLCKIYG